MLKLAVEKLWSFQKFRKSLSLVAQTVRVCLQCGRPGFNPWVGKIPSRRKWQPTPVFWPGESHGWRSLVGYSPWGREVSDRTERLHFQDENIHFKKFTKETTQSHAGLGATISCNFASLNRMKTEQSLHVCGIFYHCLLSAKMYVNIK